MTLQEEHRALEIRYFTRKYEKAHPFKIGQSFEYVTNYCRNQTIAFAKHMKEYDLRVANAKNA